MEETRYEILIHLVSVSVSRQLQHGMILPSLQQLLGQHHNQQQHQQQQQGQQQQQQQYKQQQNGDCQFAPSIVPHAMAAGNLQKRSEERN